MIGNRLDLYRIILRVRYTNKGLVLCLCMYMSVYVCDYVCVNVSMFVCMKRVTPSYIAYFDILTFEILTRGTVFLEEREVVGGLLRYLKKMRVGSPLLSSAIFSLLTRFFRSSARVLANTDSQLKH